MRLVSIDLDGSPRCEMFTQVHFSFEPLGEEAWPLSDRLAVGPGRDSDISEGLPGEPLSLSSTLTQRALCPPRPRHEPLPPGLCGLLSPAGR